TSPVHGHGLAEADDTVTVTHMATGQSATFAINVAPVIYEVTFAVRGGNGTLTASIDGTAIVSGTKVAAGTAVEFTAAPDSGYRIKGWNAVGAAVPHPMDPSDSTFTIDALTGDVYVTVEFEPVPAVTGI